MPKCMPEYKKKSQSLGNFTIIYEPRVGCIMGASNPCDLLEVQVLIIKRELQLSYSQEPVFSKTEIPNSKNIQIVITLNLK